MRHVVHGYFRTVSLSRDSITLQQVAVPVIPGLFPALPEGHSFSDGMNASPPWNCREMVVPHGTTGVIVHPAGRLGTDYSIQYPRRASPFSGEAGGVVVMSPVIPTAKLIHSGLIAMLSYVKYI